MGSWDETCAITHLPIRYGETVAFLPIVKTFREENYYCNAWDLWVPLCAPVFGSYDGYGSMESHVGSEFFYKYIFPTISHGGDGKDDAFRLIERGVCTIGTRPISRILVKLDAYNLATHETPVSNYVMENLIPYPVSKLLLQLREDEPDNYKRLAQFMRFMDTSRRLITPQSGAGAQSDGSDYELSKLTAQYILDECEKYERKVDSW